MKRLNKKELKYKPFFLLIFMILIFGCVNNPDEPVDNKSESEEVVFQRDLDEIKSDGVLKVITIYSGTSYFLYRGKTLGFEYELLERYADYLGLGLEVIIVKNQDELFDV